MSTTSNWQKPTSDVLSYKSMYDTYTSKGNTKLSDIDWSSVPFHNYDWKVSTKN
jgi:hypothetical protein